jgi:hypothetical protein
MRMLVKENRLALKRRSLICIIWQRKFLLALSLKKAEASLSCGEQGAQGRGTHTCFKSHGSQSKIANEDTNDTYERANESEGDADC